MYDSDGDTVLFPFWYFWLSLYFFLYIHDILFIENRMEFRILSSIMQLSRVREKRNEKHDFETNSLIFVTFETLRDLEIDFWINLNNISKVTNTSEITVHFCESFGTIKQVWNVPLQCGCSRNTVWNVSIAT